MWLEREFLVGREAILKTQFVCGNCRHWQKDNPILWAFTMARPIDDLRWRIYNEKMKFDNNHYNLPPLERQEIFKKNIAEIMEKCFIKNYKFLVEANKLRGIVINDVPFLGSFTVELYETNQKKEQTKT